MSAIIKYHGGKAYLARRIIDLFPPHDHYVEPFAGGLSVLLAKPRRGAEVVNDLDGLVSNFWQVLRDRFDEFKRLCDATPVSEYDYALAASTIEGHRIGAAKDCDRLAWAFFVTARQSLAGRGDTFHPLSTSRLRRGMNEQASAWLSAVDGLAAVHERLRSVVVLNRPAVRVVKQYDTPDALIYCDPPYHPETRAAADVYRCEMNDAGHRELLDALTASRAKIALSGYRCPLYDERLAGWRRVDFDLPNHAAGGKAKRRMTESVWLSYP